MKLPIQAQPVSRKVSSAMLAKKVTNAVGASSVCTHHCNQVLEGCMWAAFKGPEAVYNCIRDVGNEECFACAGEKLSFLTPIHGGPGGGNGNFDHII